MEHPTPLQSAGSEVLIWAQGFDGLGLASAKEWVARYPLPFGHLTSFAELGLDLSSATFERTSVLAALRGNRRVGLQY